MRLPMRTSSFTPAFRAVAIAGIGVIAIAPSASAHDELTVGRNAAGQLVVSADYLSPFVIPRSIFPAVPGWSSMALGWASLEANLPAEDLFTLPAGSSIQFILVASDPNMFVYNDINTEHMEIGEAYFLGSSAFMTHPLWHIPVGPVWLERTMQVRLHDLSGQSTDSELINLHFTAGCYGDITRNGQVDVQDLLAVIGGWGACPPGCHSPCPGDVTHSCAVNVEDLLAVIGAWGQCPR